MCKKSFQKSAENPEKSLFSMKIEFSWLWTKCGRSVDGVWPLKSPEKLGKTLKKIKVLPKSCFPSESRGGGPHLGWAENNFWEEL